MDVCNVETGLLRKKPCGHAAVTHCANCEQPLCADHSIPQHTDTGAKSGKFLCKECEAARRDLAKNPPPPAPSKKAPEPAKAPAAAKAAPAKEAPAAQPKPADDGGAIEFTPSKDKK